MSDHPAKLSYHTPQADPRAPWGNMPAIAQVAMGLVAYLLAAGAGIACLRHDLVWPLLAVLVLFPSFAMWVHVRWRWRSFAFGILAGLVMSFLLVGIRLLQA